MSHDQILRKDRSTLASSISVNIHSAHPRHVQNESISFSQQNDAKISSIFVSAMRAPSPGNYSLKREFSIDMYWKLRRLAEYANIMYWIYLC